MLEQFYICPYCATEVSVLLDPSVHEQTYIEDCERCCRPIEFSVIAEEGEITSFNYKLVEQ